MIYSNFDLGGLGKLERKRLSELTRRTQAAVTIGEASKILGVSRARASMQLSRIAKKGWVSRIQAGVYVFVPLASTSPEAIVEDPLAIAEKLFAPCYIGGWSAAEYWGMTEQMFRSVIVVTQRKPRVQKASIKGTDYLLHSIPAAKFFGLKTVWCNNVKVQISDPTRTVVDLINNPLLAGGIRVTLDILKYYFSSTDKSIEILIQYLAQMKRGAAYKRLGFLLEKYFPEEQQLIEECASKLTAGNTKLDATLDCRKLVTKWRLWVPENWK